MTFLETLFDPDEWGLVCNSIYETKAQPLTEDSYGQYFCINSLLPNSTRATKNVSKMRSFLLEFDCLKYDEQLKLVNDRKLPYTSCCWSGNKSLHFIITLDKPIESLDTYRNIRKKLLEKFPEADKATSDPCRLSRFPNGMNEKTKNKQDLIELRPRVSHSELESYLGDFNKLNKKPKIVYNTDKKSQKSPRFATLATLFGQRAQPGNRHQNIIAISLDLKDKGYNKEEVMDLVKSYFIPKHPDFSIQEVKGILDWAYSL